MASAYFNTTGERESLADYITAAGRQDRAILQFFADNKDRSFGPSQVYQGLIDSGVITSFTPITSVRRSITTLTTAGLLSKTARRMEGLYGRPEMHWIIAPRLQREIVEQLKLAI